MDPRPGDPEGTVYFCPRCDGDVTLGPGGRLSHADGGWIKCPVYQKPVFVFTDEDADFECDECKGNIAVSDGAAEHEDFELVECLKYRRRTSLVFLGEDGEYECDHCRGSIYVEDGEARHEENEDFGSLPKPSRKPGPPRRKPYGRHLTHVFVSYAHKDKRWLDRLKAALEPYVREKAIEVWDDTKIDFGADWQDEIQKALSRAHVAVLLVSTAFMASEFIANRELQAFFKKRKKQGMRILPVLIGPSMFQEHEVLSKVQAVNRPNRLLSKMKRSDADATLVELAGFIAKSANARMKAANGTSR